MGIRSKHQHRLRHQQISFRSRHNHGGHMGIRSIHGGHNRGDVHIHSIHREHQHQTLAQHQQISCHSSNHGGHNQGGLHNHSIRSRHQHQHLAQHQQISFHSRHNRGGHMGIHSIHGGHNQGDVHSHSSH